MRLPKKLLIAAWVLAAGLSPRPLTAEPAASSLPAVPPQPSSVILPVESPSARTLRAEVVESLGDASVQTRDGGEFVKISKGAVLHAGDVIRTGQGSCRLLIDGKTKVAVAPQTTLKVSSESLLDLHNGNLMVKLAKLKKGSTFEVTTPTATATVRGTTLYLMTGAGFAKLYVDETRGGVVWKNIISGNSVLVPAFSLSGAFADGKVEPPAALTPEQKEAFFKEWQGAGGSNLSQQFGIEEIGTGTTGAGLAALPELQNFRALSDALLDKLAEQNIFGSNGFTDLPPAPSPITPILPKEVSEEELTRREKDMIRQVIAGLVGDGDFDNADANLARVSDAQTGKVFKDVHGNRVRVDQYIFQPVPSVVEFLSLTARTGVYQNGVSAVQFLTFFNRDLAESDGALRDLPWNDYMRVVTNGDLNGGDVPATYQQFIVHEHHANEETGPSLYPVLLDLNLITPLQPQPLAVQGGIEFLELYSAPFEVNSAQGSFWVQGLAFSEMTIHQSTGETIVVSDLFFPVELHGASINGTQVSLTHTDGAQTAGLASDPNLGALMTSVGVEYFRTNGVVHPAFFEETYDGTRTLTAMFFPIDDAGTVFNAPGFNVRGMRDLLAPSPLVNDGNYNLEMLFVLSGTGDSQIQGEIFRFDAVITPEIFGRHEIIGQPGVFHPGFGLKNEDGSLDTSTVFPAQLE